MGVLLYLIFILATSKAQKNLITTGLQYVPGLKQVAEVILMATKTDKKVILFYTFIASA